MIWYPRQPTCVDDRGQSRPLLQAGRMAGSPVLRDLRLIAVIHRAHLALVAGNRWLQAADMLSRFAVFGVTLWLLRLSLPTWAAAVVAVGAMAFTPPVFAPLWRVRIRKAAGRATALLSRHAICPGCCYDLLTVRREADGCAVCPECGGAWRIGDDARRGPAGSEEPPEAAAPDDEDDDDDVQGEVIGTSGVSLSGSNELLLARDHRGLYTHLCPPNLRLPIVLAREAAHLERLELARSELRRVGRVIRWAVGVVFILFGIGFSAVFAYLVVIRGLVNGMGIWGWLLPLGGLPACLLGAAVIRGNFGYWPGRVVRILLHWGLCPGCGADLLAEAVEKDGCRRCFWCDGAWRPQARSMD